MIGGVTKVTRFCNTDIKYIENYDKANADTENLWCIHHRLETHNSDGEKRVKQITAKEMIELDMYYNRPPAELVFMTISEHQKLHKKGAGYKHSEEQKRHISESVKRYYQLHQRVIPEKVVQKMANSLRERYKTEEGKAQARSHSEIMSKKRWYNNGIISVMVEECPVGFVAGRIMKNKKRCKRG